MFILRTMLLVTSIFCTSQSFINSDFETRTASENTEEFYINESNYGAFIETFDSIIKNFPTIEHFANEKVDVGNMFSFSGYGILNILEFYIKNTSKDRKKVLKLAKNHNELVQKLKKLYNLLINSKTFKDNSLVPTIKEFLEITEKVKSENSAEIGTTAKIVIISVIALLVIGLAVFFIKCWH